MPHSKYGKYVSREIIWESKYKEITCPTAYYCGCPGGGDAIEAEYSPITSPLIMDQEPEIDAERDRFLLFGSANLKDGKEFEAECELALGPKGKKFTIDKPTLVYLPKGLWHGPVTVKNVKKPFALLDWSLQPELSTPWVAPDDSDYVIDVFKNEVSLLDLVGGGADMPPDVIAGHPGKPFRHLRNAMGGGIGVSALGVRPRHPGQGELVLHCHFQTRVLLSRAFPRASQVTPGEHVLGWQSSGHRGVRRRHRRLLRQGARTSHSEHIWRRPLCSRDPAHGR